MLLKHPCYQKGKQKQTNNNNNKKQVTYSNINPILLNLLTHQPATGADPPRFPVSNTHAWSWRFKGCFTPTYAVKRRLHKAFGCCPTAIPCSWGLIRLKQLSTAATAWVMWLCACVRCWPGRRLMSECVICSFFLKFIDIPIGIKCWTTS